MIRRLLKRWKEEWWERHSEKLALEYANQESHLKAELDELLTKDKLAFTSKLEELKREGLELETRLMKLSIKKIELSEIESRVDAKKAELDILNSELLTKIRVAESKGSPSGIWNQAYGQGFQAGYDFAIKFLPELSDRQVNLIKEIAISDTLKRFNGNHKKNN